MVTPRRDLLLPAGVVRDVRARWPDRAREWESSVSEEFRQLCLKYEARQLHVFTARYGFVASVETPRSRLVLKSTPDPAGPRQAAAAIELARLGVGPTVHEVARSEFSTWTVMDQVRPGSRDLRRATVSELVAVLSPLACASASGPFPRVSAWLQTRLNSAGAVDLAPGLAVPSRAERRNALSLLEELTPDERPSLCHGDMSSGNVLRDDAGFRLIDPRAVSGDLEYDVAVVTWKSERSVDDLVARLELDLERTKAWRSVAVAARV